MHVRKLTARWRSAREPRCARRPARSGCDRRARRRPRPAAHRPRVGRRRCARSSATTAPWPGRTSAPRSGRVTRQLVRRAPDERSRATCAGRSTCGPAVPMRAQRRASVRSTRGWPCRCRARPRLHAPLQARVRYSRRLTLAPAQDLSRASHGPLRTLAGGASTRRGDQLRLWQRAERARGARRRRGTPCARRGSRPRSSRHSSASTATRAPGTRTRATATTAACRWTCRSRATTGPSSSPGAGTADHWPVWAQLEVAARAYRRRPRLLRRGRTPPASAACSELAAEAFGAQGDALERR